MRSATSPCPMTGKAAIHGWLLLLPAAVLLVAFTHYPAAATIVHSFFSTARAARAAGFIGLGEHNWLGDRDTVLGCLIVVTVWKEAGFFMIFYLAALQQISPSLGEAAAIEGAGRWYVFRRVTFPLLMPTTLFVLVNAVINSFRLIDHIVVMTRGGPDNASSLLLYYIYDVAFKFWDT